MRKTLTALTLLTLATVPAWAEAGRILLAPGAAPVVIDSQRLQGDTANTYAVTIGGDHDGVFSLELKPNARDLHPHLRLADAEAGTVHEAHGEEDGKVLRTALPLGPGEYVLEIDDTHRNTRAAPYRLTATFKVDTDRFEPNNSFETAKPLSLGQATPVTLFRFKEADEDYFTVRHPGGALQVTVSALQGVHPGVRLYNADREEVGGGQAANEGATLRHTEELPAGDYTIVFYDASESNRPGTLQVTVQAK